jgi:hypothetical protein
MTANFSPATEGQNSSDPLYHNNPEAKLSAAYNRFDMDSHEMRGTEISGSFERGDARDDE